MTKAIAVGLVAGLAVIFISLMSRPQQVCMAGSVEALLTNCERVAQ
jgi:hypothetical protein